ncbi:hypothetical protein [Nostoc sphaeroides]|uniref:Uncharacterized protein n=1 Tax=Nostoc sphaeroides CCNUC1 TaxID=2653204 RepID=A0A5P8W9R4_9NOSO|nr:hypothetical protein [Nostoc sphaeroides]QFS49505.1 hypothetical protein GXM_06999 [Nostoc sphaeroides CCNUC1]
MFNHKFLNSCFFISILIISGCSNQTKSDSSKDSVNDKDANFELNIKYFLDNTALKEKVVFDELFGIEKSKVEAKEYCKRLDSGENKINILNQSADSLKEKVDKHIINQKESDAIFSVTSMIHLTAQDIYCPQHRDNSQIPLKERLKP